MHLNKLIRKYVHKITFTDQKLGLSLCCHSTSDLVWFVFLISQFK